MAEIPEGWALVPVDETPQATARALLDLADDPRDVVWQAGANEFLVRDTVGEQYRKSVSDKPARRTRAKRENSDG